MPKRNKRPAFTHSCAIFTEGTEDAAFLRALTNARGLQFDIRANVNLGGTPGKTGFKTAIEASEPITGFDRVSDVVLIADNDENATQSFNEIINQIDEAQICDSLDRPWAIPNQPERRTTGDPSVSIWMWPTARRRGCLETLFWRVLRDVHPDWAQCAIDALACTGIERPNISVRDKALVRSFISIACRRSIISVTQIWDSAPELIPLDHKEFNPVVRFLASL